MTNENIETIRARWAKASPGEWTAYRMTSEETGDNPTPAEVGEYVKNSVIKSATESRSMMFLAVLVQKADGPADVCLVGNGPTSPANALAIASAPADVAALLAEVEKMRPAWEAVEQLRIARAAHVAADDAWIAAGRPPMLLRDGDLAEHPTVVSFYETLTAREGARANLIALTSADDERGRA